MTKAYLNIPQLKDAYKGISIPKGIRVWDKYYGMGPDLKVLVESYFALAGDENVGSDRLYYIQRLNKLLEVIPKLLKDWHIKQAYKLPSRKRIKARLLEIEKEFR